MKTREDQIKEKRQALSDIVSQVEIRLKQVARLNKYLKKGGTKKIRAIFLIAYCAIDIKSFGIRYETIRAMPIKTKEFPKGGISFKRDSI